MSSAQMLFFMGWVGSLAGLISWALGEWIPVLVRLPAESAWMTEVIDSGLIGAVMGLLCVVFGDHWSGRGLRLRRWLLGLLASVAGVAGTGILVLSRDLWLADAPYWLVTLAAWVLPGGFIGLVLGVIRCGLVALRLALSLFGGAFGATLGGSAVLLLGTSQPFVVHAIGMMLTGLGIALGSTWAVYSVRRATLRFLESDDLSVVAFFRDRNQEWELLPGDRYLIGNSVQPSGSGPSIVVPDPELGPRNAFLRETDGAFLLQSHPDNRDAKGEPVYTLEVERAAGDADTAAPELACFSRGAILQHGDRIQLGRSRFEFSLRGSNDPPAATATVLLAGLLLVIAPAPPTQAAQADELSQARLVAADDGCLLEAPPGSEQPALRFDLNIVDYLGRPLKLPVLDPEVIRQAPQVLDRGTSLEVLYAGSVEDPPERYTMLLVDVSGSMRDKFGGVPIACRRFAADFVEGVDRIAVVPFASKAVVAGVENAVFHSRKAALAQAIEDIPTPQQARETLGLNTGFYSAVAAALERLESEGNKRLAAGVGEVQLLLVAMTDGENDVGNEDDDSRLETEPGPVVEIADRVGAQLITVGFGDPGDFNPEVLRRLAWPSAANYLPARHSEDLVAAFQSARKFQVERLRLTFLLAERFRKQLLARYTFHIRLELQAGTRLRGRLSWARPASLTAPPFECEISSDEADAIHEEESFSAWLWRYLTVLLAAATLHYWLYAHFPRWAWADRIDADVLRRRAFETIKAE